MRAACPEQSVALDSAYPSVMFIEVPASSTLSERRELGISRAAGDIVAVKGSEDGTTPGKTFLTVKNSGNSGSCNGSDCLVEVDPKTGKLVKLWGKVGFDNVFGLAFWGGSVYGFDDAGDLFEVTFNGSQLTTAKIPVSNAPAGLKFWGAGSTTSAPIFPPAK